MCPKCTKSELMQKYEFSDEILTKMKFNNDEFKFKKEEHPELIFGFNNDHGDYDDDDLDDLFFEEEGEENTSDDWNKF